MSNNGFRYVVAVRLDKFDICTICELPYWSDLKIGDLVFLGDSEEYRGICASEVNCVDEQTYRMLCKVIMEEHHKELEKISARYVVYRFDWNNQTKDMSISNETSV